MFLTDVSTRMDLPTVPLFSVRKLALSLPGLVLELCRMWQRFPFELAPVPLELRPYSLSPASLSNTRQF